MIAKEFPSPFPEVPPGPPGVMLPVCRDVADVLQHWRTPRAPEVLDPALARRWRRYLERLAAPAAAMQQLARLESGALAVVAGQQAGLLTGPLYTVLKAARAVSLARELEAALHAPVVPVFWIAADDHDLGEINHTFVRTRGGELLRLRLPLPESRQPAGHLEVPPEAGSVLRELASATGHPEDDSRLSAFQPQPGDSLSTWFARCLLSLFGRHGLVPLEPELLGPAAHPLFASILERPSAYREALARGAAPFRAAGLEEPLPLDPETPFFVIDAQGRQRLQTHGSHFRIPGEELTGAQLLSREAQGQRLSADASLRPLLQNAVLPVLAAVGGPGELRYWTQLVPLHQAYSVPLPAAVMRPSAVILDRAAMRALRKLSLPWEELLPALANREAGAPGARTLLRAGEEVQRHLEDYLGAVQEEGGALWASTSRKAEQLRRGAGAFLEALRRTVEEGAARTQLRWAGLEILVMPRGQPQDRVLNALPFWLDLGDPLVDTLLMLPGKPGATWLLASPDGGSTP